MINDLNGISFTTWLYFYRMKAGLMTVSQFANELSMENPSANIQKLNKDMEEAANPLLIQSVQYYWCTGMRDREKSLELLQDAFKQEDLFAAYLLTQRNGKW